MGRDDGEGEKADSLAQQVLGRKEGPSWRYPKRWIDPPCGSRALSPYKAAERLPNLVVLCHECGLAWRPTEAVWCGRGKRTAA